MYAGVFEDKAVNKIRDLEQKTARQLGRVKIDGKSCKNVNAHGPSMVIIFWSRRAHSLCGDASVHQISIISSTVGAYGGSNPGLRSRNTSRQSQQ